MTPVQETMPGLLEAIPGGGGPAALHVGARREAMARAGRLLATRPRTEKELGDRLARAGFEPDVIASALERLRDLGLVDDAEFARQWVEERAGRKLLSARVLRDELRAKGVEAGVADDVIGAAGLDEEAQAVELAAKLVRKVASKPLAEQFSRIRQMLARRGYSNEAAEMAARRVLPPEDWD